MSSIARSLLVLFAVVVHAAAPAGAATVTIVSAFVDTYAEEDTFGGVTETFFPMALPFVMDSSATDGATEAKSSYMFGNAGLWITLDHVTGSGQTAQTATDGTIFFTVDIDVSYVLDGFFEMDSAGPRTVSQVVDLRDVTDEGMFFSLYQSTQVSQMASSVALTLGLGGGDTVDTQAGSLAGTLFAGRTYSFFYLAGIEAGGMTSATGAGNFHLSLPEPGASALALLAAVAMVGRARSRRFGSA